MPWMLKSVRWLATGLVLAFLLTACGNKPSFDSKFVALYVELRVASQEFGLITPEARRARLQAMKRAGYTQAQFEATYQGIMANPDIWKEFQDQVTHRLDSLTAQTPAQKNKPVVAPAPPARKFAPPAIKHPPIPKMDHKK